METQVYKMEKKTDKISHADLVQKYLKPYLRFSLPLCALETTALWLLLRCGSAFWSLMLGFLLLVVFPLLLLWHFLFSRWYPGRFLCVHVHVWLVCISQGLAAVWLVIGHQATAAFSAGWQWLAWLPALVVYALGVGYVYFFGKRNETVYLTKKSGAASLRPAGGFCFAPTCPLSSTATFCWPPCCCCTVLLSIGCRFLPVIWRL